MLDPNTHAENTVCETGIHLGWDAILLQVPSTHIHTNNSHQEEIYLNQATHWHVVGFFGLWKEAQEPRENPYRHRENMRRSSTQKETQVQDQPEDPGAVRWHS